GVDGGRLPVEGVQFLTRVSVPQFDDPVAAAAGERPAVRTVRRGKHSVRVSAERGPLLTGAHVPQFDAAPGSGGEGLPVRAESHGENVDVVSVEDGAFLAR